MAEEKKYNSIQQFQWNQSPRKIFEKENADKIKQSSEHSSFRWAWMCAEESFDREMIILGRKRPLALAVED